MTLSLEILPDMLQDLITPWSPALTALLVVVDLFTTGHAILNKRDTRAAIAWVGFIWLVPIAGSLLYFLLGINRVRRRAQSLRTYPRFFRTRHFDTTQLTGSDYDAALADLGATMQRLARTMEGIHGSLLQAGNHVTPLNRQTAYPTMLDAIANSTTSITLMSYIFDNDPTGRQFVEALSGAVQRGVAVRVLVDDIGAKYTRPSIVRLLRKARIPHAIFLPRFAPWSFPYANLRNHRKVLIVDGNVGFTGGMNIRHGHSPDATNVRAIEDLHFRVTGPVVRQFQEAFAEDWHFTDGEQLLGITWFPPLAATGGSLCRGILAGPDETKENLRWTIQAALACANHRVAIVTPYFLPDSDLITALNMAVMRGTVVDIVLPRVNNQRLVEWASTAIRWQVLERGCRIWLTEPPFDHTKLMLLDDAWTMFGSANWDPRSLRLNFEFNVECYDRSLTQQLFQIVDDKIQRAIQLTQADVDARSLPLKLRDGLARLLSPYL
ncbi:MAG: phospholipase D-like domain-containing protein [Planctomycetota bacterium]|nr:phospholipase D-like domain-containing protein [Planctomycetota bacterium]